MPVRTCDVLIIGAGIAGSAVALELAHAGVDVVVAERGAVCSGSSALNAGGVRHQFSQEPNIRAAIATVKRIATFAEEFGVDVGFQQAGYLFLFATEEQERIFSQAVALQNQLGVRTRFVSHAEMQELVPGMNTTDVRAGAFGPDDGYLDPHSVVSGFASAARRAGAVILEEHPVVGIRVHGDRVAEVETPTARIVPDRVLNAAGVWSPLVARLYGHDLPITPRRSSLYVARPRETPEGRFLPLTIDYEQRIYFHTEARSSAAVVFGVGGADLVSGPPPLEVSCNWSRLPDAVTRLAHRFPALETAEVTHGWAGLVEGTPDDNPIVGWTHLANVYTMAGFSGHGMCIAPGLAPLAAAELRGEKPDFALDIYRLERFASGGTEGEHMFGVNRNAAKAGL